MMGFASLNPSCATTADSHVQLISSATESARPAPGRQQFLLILHVGNVLAMFYFGMKDLSAAKDVPAQQNRHVCAAKNSQSASLCRPVRDPSRGTVVNAQLIV
jgi:hypothetical protein